MNIDENSPSLKKVKLCKVYGLIFSFITVSLTAGHIFLLMILQCFEGRVGLPLDFNDYLKNKPCYTLYVGLWTLYEMS